MTKRNQGNLFNLLPKEIIKLIYIYCSYKPFQTESIIRNYIPKIPLCVTALLKKKQEKGIMSFKNQERFQITGFFLNAKYQKKPILEFLMKDPNGRKTIDISFEQKETKENPDITKKRRELSASYLDSRKTTEWGTYVDRSCRTMYSHSKSFLKQEEGADMAGCPFREKSDSIIHQLLLDSGIKNIDQRNKIIQESKEKSEFAPSNACKLHFEYLHNIKTKEEKEQLQSMRIYFPFEFFRYSVEFSNTKNQ